MMNGRFTKSQVIIGIAIATSLLIGLGVFLYKQEKNFSEKANDRKFAHSLIEKEANKVCRENTMSNSECEKLKQEYHKRIDDEFDEIEADK